MDDFKVRKIKWFVFKMIYMRHISYSLQWIIETIQTMVITYNIHERNACLSISSLFFLARQKAVSGRRVLDEYARKRRQKRQLDALEMDNFGDDPHANLSVASCHHSQIQMVRLIMFAIVYIRLCLINFKEKGIRKGSWGLNSHREMEIAYFRPFEMSLLG